jgi:ferredoxin
MADKTNQLPQNAPGPYYVDSSCIDCDLCRITAADFFRRDDETGHSFAYRQPSTADDVAKAEEGRLGCPTDSIGKDGA